VTSAPSALESAAPGHGHTIADVVAYTVRLNGGGCAAGGQRPYIRRYGLLKFDWLFVCIVQVLDLRESVRTERLQSHRARLPPAQSVASCFKMLNLEVTAKLF